MRKLIVCNIISLDGFFSGPGGNVMAMPFDNGFSDYNLGIALLEDGRLADAYEQLDDTASALRWYRDYLRRILPRS